MNKTLLLNLFLCSFLAACGGEGGSSSSSGNDGNNTDNNGDNADNTPKELTMSLAKPWAEDGSTILAADEPLVFNFSEPMQINTLALSGNMLPDCGDEADSLACLDLAWNQETNQLTLKPKDGFYWYANTGTFGIAITGDSDASLNINMSATVLPVFKNHQAADIVIGQESFTTGDPTTSDKGLYDPKGISLIEEAGNTALLVVDSFNNRVVKYDTIPTSNHATHSAVFGQPDSESKGYGTAKNQLDAPTDVSYMDGMIYILDVDNQRSIAVENEQFSTEGIASTVVGKDSFTAYSSSDCSSTNLNYSFGLNVVKSNGELYWLVSDTDNERVMVWKNPTLPSAGAEASYVLGQDSMDTCLVKTADSHGLDTLRHPYGVWSNGEKLITVSRQGRRLLVWNQFPTETGVVPDFQLGQETDFDSDDNAGQNSANRKGFAYPSNVGGNDHQICVTDDGLNRVTIWHSLPNSSEDLADVVIGQQDFDSQSDEDSINSQNLNDPKGCDISMEQLFIADSDHNRVLIYNALNKRPESF